MGQNMQCRANPALQEDWRFIYSLTGQQKHVGLLKKKHHNWRGRRKK